MNHKLIMVLPPWTHFYPLLCPLNKVCELTEVLRLPCTPISVYDWNIYTVIWTVCNWQPDKQVLNYWTVSPNYILTGPFSDKREVEVHCFTFTMKPLRSANGQPSWFQHCQHLSRLFAPPSKWNLHWFQMPLPCTSYLNLLLLLHAPHIAHCNHMIIALKVLSLRY